MKTASSRTDSQEANKSGSLEPASDMRLGKVRGDAHSMRSPGHRGLIETEQEQSCQGGKQSTNSEILLAR